MSADETVKQDHTIEMEFEIDEPPQKVWRAISIPEFRQSWLPSHALADTEAASVTQGEEVSYRIREMDAPFTESLVTFRIAPNANGGTCLQVIHELTGIRHKRMEPTAANSNNPVLMLAA
ncbi:SRPBCC domain-containing protein [Phyllobacterium phragmitis]|uniref:SRPBCC domain-containing protein n=1 Tax=Phyllobacterium phragmitis TaxID=2670329 RepID=A0ABQ0GX67_9HYPH